MTPPAATVAGRSAGKKRSTGSGKGAAPPPGHRRSLRQKPAPKAPRRVSGPVGGVVAVPPREAGPPPAPVRAPAPARATPKPRPPQQEQRTRPARLRAPERPRRQRPAVRQPRARRRAPSAPLGARALHALRTLPDHRLLDRLIRGRAWIPLLGVMLVGIVAMQVEVLKLGASIGRSIERSSSLQTRNEMLRQQVASLNNDARIQSLATKQGMVMTEPGNVGFLSAGDGAAAVGRALANIHLPDAPGFLALVTTNGTIATTSNSSTTGLAGLATMSATLAGTLAQSAAQTPSATSTSQTGATSTAPTVSPSTTTPASTQTTPTTPASAGSSPPTTSGSPTTGTPSQSSSSPSGTGTPVSTPTQSTSSGASGSGGASLGG